MHYHVLIPIFYIFHNNESTFQGNSKATSSKFDAINTNS